MHIFKKIGKFIKTKWWIGVLVLGIGAFIWYRQTQAHTTLDPDKLYTVDTKTLRDTLSLSGSMDAEEKVSLTFPTGGKLVWIGAEEGDMVEQYQGLASLDQRQLENQMKKSLNTYEKVRKSFDQTTDDNEEYVYEDNEDGDKMKRLIQMSQADLDNSVIDVEIQQIAKEDSYLYSPIAGIVTKAVHPYPGVNISPTQVQFEVVNPTTMYFSARADQAEVVKLSQGMTGEVTLDSFVEQQVMGSIQDISFTPIEGEVGTVYEVKILLNSPSMDKYRLGMTGDIFFKLREKPDTLAIPSEFLQIDEEENTYVMRKTEEGLQRRSVTIGEEIEGDIEITKGLQEGDVIYEELL